MAKNFSDSNDPCDAASPNRRPIKSRSSKWVQGLARMLLHSGVSPNQISIMSIVFALIGSIFLAWEALGTSFAWPLIATAMCIQLRLLANVLDGLVAVEGQRESKSGELYNEIPDRVADLFFLAAAGYASGHGAWGIALGWSASVLATNTAYIRALGSRRGFSQDFCGPQAKQHRMFLLTLGCLAAAIEKWLGLPSYALFFTLIFINLGTFLTCLRRIIRLKQQLESHVS